MYLTSMYLTRGAACLIEVFVQFRVDKLDGGLRLSTLKIKKYLCNMLKACRIDTV